MSLPRALFIILLLMAVILPACKTGPCPPPAPLDATLQHSLPPGVTIREERNGVIVPRSWQYRSDRPDHAGLVALRGREGLDAVVEAGTDEWSRMRLLNSWVNSQFPVGVPEVYPEWDANQVLTMIRDGRTGGFCAQYAVVMVQACLALGWPARYLELKPLDPKDGGGHVMVEVWSNQFNQWVVLDPSFDASFERGGRPLSALEAHAAVAGGRAGEISVVHGAGSHWKKNLGGQDRQLVMNFHHFAASLENDHLSHPLRFWDRADTYLAFRDQFTDGLPEIYRQSTTDPLDFGFPLNQAEALLMPGPVPGTLTVQIRTNMSDPAALEIAHPPGPWRRQELPLPTAGAPGFTYALSLLHGRVINYEWQLTPGDNEFRLRFIDRVGNIGPETSLKVVFSPSSN